MSRPVCAYQVGTMSNETRILLGSGTWFDYKNPDASQVTVEDLAYGLAFACRFAGQCVVDGKRQFYSVAEHCVRMSWAVPSEVAYDALMHEAGECVCGDAPGPLKHACQPFRTLEKECEAALFTRFDVTM